MPGEIDSTSLFLMIVGLAVPVVPCGVRDLAFLVVFLALFVLFIVAYP